MWFWPNREWVMGVLKLGVWIGVRIGKSVGGQAWLRKDYMQRDFADNFGTKGLSVPFWEACFWHEMAEV